MHSQPQPTATLDYQGPASLPVLVLSAVEEDLRDHVVSRQPHRDRSVFARGLVAELVLAGALEIRDHHVDVVDGPAIESLAAPCGVAVRATLARDLPVKDLFAALEGPAYTVAWTALQGVRAARKSRIRGWVLTNPEVTFWWHRMLASAHQDPDTTNDRAAVLWTILAEAGLHRDQLRVPALQPRSACPDALCGLLLPSHERRRARVLRHLHR